MVSYLSPILTGHALVIYLDPGKQRQIATTTNTDNTTQGPIALSHVVLCPNHHWAWIEGIRVHPKYRRHKVATALIGKMLEYGKIHGATEAYAIISDDNIASQSLFKNHNFEFQNGYTTIFIYIIKLIKTGTRRRKIQQEWHRAMILMMFGIT